ncbi:MAG: ADP-ribosylglycohydrolase family protein [Aphanothece sp. CMT-3BRIN-NPC111]|jgi:hypothetical protein|nr:ADP-ribosylglycohydrolase family protein [Aphanothece sp. CMT-3BRIN-NPC111]
MRYSLLSRFRGTVLGAALGENYGFQYKPLTRLGVELETNVGVDTHACPGNQMAICAESLIRYGRINVEDLVHQLSLLQQPLLSSKNGAASCSEIAVATLPVALFFHESKVILREQLMLASATWLQANQKQKGSQASDFQPRKTKELIQDCQPLTFSGGDNPKSKIQNPKSHDYTVVGGLAVGYAIAQALTEKLNPATLIEQTIAYLHDSQAPLVQQLAQVQTLLKQGATLEMALMHLCRDTQQRNPCTPIALAFYCFLSTPEDFRLSVTRAIRTGYQPQITAALTGALSGVYNSLTGIPLEWRLSFNRSDSSKMLQLADSLLAVWSGVYDPSTAEPCPLVAVAAPNVMQRRHTGL